MCFVVFFYLRGWFWFAFWRLVLRFGIIHIDPHLISCCTSFVEILFCTLQRVCVNVQSVLNSSMRSTGINFPEAYHMPTFAVKIVTQYPVDISKSLPFLVLLPVNLNVPRPWLYWFFDLLMLWMGGWREGCPATFDHCWNIQRGIHCWLTRCHIAKCPF